MTEKHILYGAEFSLYSGKARSYLRYKRIPFDEILSSLSVYKKTIVPNTGVRFIPVVKTPDDQYLQDTSHIIDTLEAAFPERSVMPDGPRQRLASLLLELYGDEWLLLPAMHYRWNHDNFPFIFDEFGRTLFPRWPAFVRRTLGKRIGARFRGFLPLLGIMDRTHAAIENWYEQDFLPALNQHFAEHDFLFGGRPSIGDFGLIGPLYAHLYRDPCPGALMRRDAPQVAAWVERMIEPADHYGEWLADDEIPEMLTPIFKRMFAEHWPVLTSTATQLGIWAQENEGPAVPRRIGEHQFSIGDVTETRAVLPGSLWKMQRPLDDYASLSGEARQQTDDFLRRAGGLEALQFQLPVRVTRVRNSLCLDV
ncbi:MAG: glutathione S-transferase [Desulfobulbaceae bacterium]|nr:glutathione S-transferase [Desulfobulbaceae bacterium]